MSRLIFLEVICLPTALSSLINLCVFIREIYYCLDIRSLFFTRTSSKMAGNEDACKYVILLFITVVSRLFQDRRRRRFQERLRLLAVQSGRKKIEAWFFQRILEDLKFGQRRKSDWVLERPQFWFEHMVLNKYEDNLWCEHFRVSRQTFRYIYELLGRHLVSHNANMRQAIPVQKRVGVAMWRLATGNSYRKNGLIFGVGRCTALKIEDEFCSALLRVGSYFIKFPKGEAERRRAIEVFQELSSFPPSCWCN